MKNLATCILLGWLLLAAFSGLTFAHDLPTQPKSKNVCIPRPVFIHNSLNYAISCSDFPLSYIIDYTDRTEQIGLDKQTETNKRLKTLWDKNKSSSKLLAHLADTNPGYKWIMSKASLVFCPEKSALDKKISFEIKDASVEIATKNLSDQLGQHFTMFLQYPPPWNSSQRVSIPKTEDTVVNVLCRLAESVGPDVYWMALYDSKRNILSLSFRSVKETSGN